MSTLQVNLLVVKWSAWFFTTAVSISKHNISSMVYERLILTRSRNDAAENGLVSFVCNCVAPIRAEEAFNAVLKSKITGFTKTYKMFVL